MAPSKKPEKSLPPMCVQFKVQQQSIVTKTKESRHWGGPEKTVIERFTYLVGQESSPGFCVGSISHIELASVEPPTFEYGRTYVFELVGVLDRSEPEPEELPPAPKPATPAPYIKSPGDIALERVADRFLGRS